MTARLVRPFVFAATACVAVLLSGCDKQSLGGTCNTNGNDCESPLVCVTLQGHAPLGTCCMPNSQCGTSSTGLVLSQSGSTSQPMDASGDVEDGGDSASVGSEAGDASHPDSTSDAVAPAEGSADATSEAADASGDATDASSDTKDAAAEAADSGGG